MSDNVIKCNCCGFPLETSSTSQNRIKCPKCGVVNVITPPEKERSAHDSESIVGGIPISVGGAAIHKSIISWIFKNHTIMPPDIFQELRLTSVERISVPCYLFECNASIRYSYEAGNQRERVRRIGEEHDYTETYKEYTHQNDVYEFSGCILVSQNAQFAKPIQSIYNELTVSDVVALDNLKYPSDVKEYPSDVSFSIAQDEVKAIIGNRSQEQIKKILERTDHRELQVRDDFRIDNSSAPKQILVPLVHVTFTYKDKTGDVWLTGDATRVKADYAPVDISYNEQIKQYNSKMQLSFSCCLPIALGLLFVWMGIIAFFVRTSTSSEALCALLIGGLFLGLGGFLMYRTDSSVKRAEAELEKFTHEHNRIFVQFIKRQIPLHGIWEKTLCGKPEAFPENVIRAQLNITSIGSQKAEVIRIASQSAKISQQDAEVFFKKVPITITVATDAEADSIQKELESVGATVERSYILPDKQ